MGALLVSPRFDGGDKVDDQVFFLSFLPPGHYARRATLLSLFFLLCARMA